MEHAVAAAGAGDDVGGSRGDSGVFDGRLGSAPAVRRGLSAPGALRTSPVPCVCVVSGNSGLELALSAGVTVGELRSRVCSEWGTPVERQVLENQEGRWSPQC